MQKQRKQRKIAKNREQQTKIEKPRNRDKYRKQRQIDINTDKQSQIAYGGIEINRERRDEQRKIEKMDKMG